MRIRLVKHLLWNCFRLTSKRNDHICWIFVFIFNCSHSNSVDSSPFDDILDNCMLDDSPCYPDIEQALHRYFPKLKKQFSMLLTYHPRIDCEHGRYLLLNDSLSSHVHDGTGSQLMWYLGVLNVAYKLNLTVIHLEWTAEHTGDEANLEREKYWKFFDWEIPYSAYKSCPENSSVKQNIFKYNLISNQTFDQHHHGKKPYTIMSHFKLSFDHFINNLKNNNNGFTFYSSRTYTLTSSLMEIGVVFETRWWLQHRKVYNQHDGVWSGAPLLSNYFPIDYFQYIKSHSTINSIQCPLIDTHNNLLIGVHIRQGDVVKRNKSGRIISAVSHRFISNSAYIPLLTFILNALPIQMQNKYLITIYSEGVISDFDDILLGLKSNLPKSRCRLSFVLNGRTSETFNRLLRDDIAIGARSTFSLATGIFNSRQLKIGSRHNRARVHGMRNHLSLSLNQNHTLFHITDDKKILIKQRIKYVWQQKRLQRKTSIPLWLDNYSTDYPEKFMLI